MAGYNKYEWCCCSNPPVMALCGDTAAVFVFKSMTYGLKVTDEVICLLINTLYPQTSCIVCSPTVFGPNCMV